MPLISVCLIAESSAELILKSCTSVLEQTFEDFEILIAAAEEKQQNLDLPQVLKLDSRVRMLQIVDNRTAQLNGLLKASKGTFVQFLEVGDVLEPHCLQTFARAFAVAPEVVLMAGANRFSTTDGVVIEEPALDQVDEYDVILDGRKIAKRAINYLEPSFEQLTAVCFRKDFALLGFDDSYFFLSQFEFFIRLLAQGDCIFLSDRLCKISKIERQTATTCVKESMIWLADFIRLRDSYQQFLRSEQIDYVQEDFYSERWSGEDSLVYLHLSRQLERPLLHHIETARVASAAKELNQWPIEHIVDSYARLTSELGKCLRTINWWKNYTSIESKKRIENAYEKGRADATKVLQEAHECEMRELHSSIDSLNLQLGEFRTGRSAAVGAALKKVARKIKTRLERKNG